MAYTDGYQGKIIKLNIEEYLQEDPTFEFALSPENAKLLIAVNNDTTILFDEESMMLNIPAINLFLPVIYKDDVKRLFQHFVDYIDNAEYKASINPKVVESVLRTINSCNPEHFVDIYVCRKGFLISQGETEMLSTFNQVRGGVGFNPTFIRNIRNITDSYDFLIPEVNNDKRDNEDESADTDNADNSNVSDNNEGDGADTTINEEGNPEEAN